MEGIVKTIVRLFLIKKGYIYAEQKSYSFFHEKFSKMFRNSKKMFRKFDIGFRKYIPLSCASSIKVLHDNITWLRQGRRSKGHKCCIKHLETTCHILRING